MKKCLSLVSCVSFLVLASQAQANSLNYPTVWNIQNHSNSALSVECSNPAQGLYQPIVMRTSSPIASGSTFTYTWRGWHNDGMGLNPGTWTCSATRPDGSPSRKSQFKTGWGENITLEIQDDQEDFVIFKR